VIRTYEDVAEECRSTPGRHYLLHLVVRLESISEEDHRKLKGDDSRETRAGRVVVADKFFQEVHSRLNFSTVTKIISARGVTEWDAVIVSSTSKAKLKQLKGFLLDMEKRLFSGRAGDFAIFSKQNRPLAPIAAGDLAPTKPSQARVADVELFKENKTIAAAAQTSVRLVRAGGDGYEIRHNKKHRVLVRHKGTFVPVMWLTVSSDASIVLGPYIPKANFARIGIAQANNGKVFFEYEGGEQIDITDIHPVSKVTLHSSGCTHALGRRAFRKSFREIDQQEELCFLVFQHPDNYEKVDDADIRSTDIVANFEVSDQHPFYCQVLVSPINGVQVIEYREQRQEWRVLLLCHNLPKTEQEFAFQLYFGDRQVAPWPPYTFLALNAKPDNWKE
jgi:hypothetical protein